MTFDPKAGYPGGPNVYFECGRCGEVIPSMPKESSTCKCGNVRIDVEYGRVAVSDDARMRAFVQEGDAGT